MRALDGLSERQMRDAAGDKQAGQQLAREAHQLSREQQNVRDRSTSRSFNPIDVVRADAREQESHRVEQQNQEQRQKLVEQHKQSEQNQRRNADGKFAPSMLDGRNWQKDGSGTFVTRAKDGRLLTADANGKLVDYQSHMNQKHMASQDQMAFASILFCNPLMLLGMGATFAMMDQSHGAKTAKLSQDLNQKFDGRQHNARAMQSGYASELSQKAALIAQCTGAMGTREIGKVSPLPGSAKANFEKEFQRRIELKKKQEADEQLKRRTSKASMPTDRYSMSTKKLMKTKRLIEDEIERVRGKASLEEVSKLYAQVEVLDKALKRLSNM